MLFSILFSHLYKSKVFRALCCIYLHCNAYFIVDSKKRDCKLILSVTAQKVLQLQKLEINY